MLRIDKPMPESCDRCIFNYDWINCRALPDDGAESLSGETDTTVRQDWCPLKAWDPLAPEIEGGSVTWWWVCGECHGEVGSRDKYCRHCGREIAWDEVQLQGMRTENA